MEVKEQYLLIRDYLETETQKRIDAFLADERVQNFYYYLVCCKYMSQGERGFDLLISEDGVNFDVITRDGMGDPYNHGCRVFAITDSGLCIGTANPVYGAQVWLLDENKEEELLIGDVNCDGKISVTDVRKLASAIASANIDALGEQGVANADVSGDGRITVTDVRKLASAIASGK